MVGQVLSDIARARLEDELALVRSHVSFFDNPIASAGDVDMVRLIDEEDMTQLNDVLRSLKEVGEQIDDQLFADQVSCLRCMIRGKQRASVLKLMLFSALSCKGCRITEERAKLLSAARASRHALQAFVGNPSWLHQRSAPLADFHLNFSSRSSLTNRSLTTPSRTLTMSSRTLGTSGGVTSSSCRRR